MPRYTCTRELLTLSAGGEMLNKASDRRFLRMVCNPRHHSCITAPLTTRPSWGAAKKAYDLTFWATWSSADSLGTEGFLLTRHKKESRRGLGEGKPPALRNQVRQWVYPYVCVPLKNRASRELLKLLQFEERIIIMTVEMCLCLPEILVLFSFKMNLTSFILESPSVACHAISGCCLLLWQPEMPGYIAALIVLWYDLCLLH